MITIELKDEGIAQALSRLAAGMADLSPVMNEIATYMLRATKERFKTGIGPDGAAWAPRSPVTLALYQKRGLNPGAKPLTLEGDLEKSIHPAYGSDFAEVQAGDWKSSIMQFGAVKGSLGAYWFLSKTGREVEGSSPWGNIPARPFIGFSKDDTTEIATIISEWLERLAEA